MTDETEMRVMDAQHAEIDNAKDTLRKLTRFLRRFVKSDTIVGRHTESYLRGVHDGIKWGQREIDCITQYDDYGRQYDVREIPDEQLSETLTHVVSEANNENWGDVEHLLTELAEDLSAGDLND